jgi:2-dehydro-3-deoxygalactonokinase
MMREDALDEDSFSLGVARAADPGGLLHHLFGVRTLGLAGTLSNETAAAYLSGLLIGHEVGAELAVDTPVHLLGTPHLCALYERAITLLGGRAHLLDADAAARGLAVIGGMADWRRKEGLFF